ncbi:hypothetical protein ACOSQ3_009656 [Xanthoceras sorbifolium]
MFDSRQEQQRKIQTETLNGFSRTKPYAFTFCYSQIESPIRRSAAPSPPSVVKLVPPSPRPQQQQTPKPASRAVAVEDKMW